MLEKPPLADSEIIACLHGSYGLAARAIEFLPLGYDTNAGVYRVHTDGRDYFLKVRSGPVDALSAILPRALLAAGFEHAIAPLPAITGDLWGRIGDFTLLVYPFVETQDGPLPDAGWVAFGAALRRLHEVQLSPDVLTLVPRETFVPLPKWAALVERLHVEAATRTTYTPAEAQVAALWREQRPEIDRIVAQADRLGRMLQGRSEGFVLCHADIHTGNLLLDRDDRLYIVDWDQPVFAPRERDLMFTTLGDFVKDPRHEDLFFQGYGRTDIDPLVMDYYHYERLMEDIALFAETALLSGSGEETVLDSLRWLRVLLEKDGDEGGDQ